MNGVMLIRIRRIANCRLPLVAEMGFLALVILAWEVARIPIQGSHSLSLAHARDWLSLEHTLHIDIEAWVIQTAHDANLHEVLRWSYYNFHLPVLFGFMVLARLLCAERYPFLRTAFVLSHIPAIAIIGLYPLLPPRWVPGMPFAVAAPEGMNGSMHNATAAAASQHCGYPIFIAVSTVWLTNRARWSWLAFLYPAAVFLIVVSTANHYTLDAIIGGLCIGFGFVVARLVHGSVSTLRHELRPALGPSLLAALGYAFVVRAIDTASDLTLPPHPVSGTDLVLIAGTCAVIAAWWWSRGNPSGNARWERSTDGQTQDARSGA
jgi:hypothetical protein